MLFTLLTVVYSFIVLIAFFGDYKSKELEKQKKEYEKIMGKKYY